MNTSDRGVRQLPLPGPDFDLLLTRAVTPAPVPQRRRVPLTGITQLDFFAHFPGSDWPPAEMLRDLRAATRSVSIVCPWFTDTQLARALVFSRAPQRSLVIGDGANGRPPGLALIQVAAYPEIAIYRVGSADALMHRKRITIDDAIAWFGSANPTRGARRNHEELWRQVGGVEAYREQDEYLRHIGSRLSAA